MIQNYNGYKVLKEFMENPLTGYKLRELSRNLKLGLPSISKYVKRNRKRRDGRITDISWNKTILCE